MGPRVVRALRRALSLGAATLLAILAATSVMLVAFPEALRSAEFTEAELAAGGPGIEPSLGRLPPAPRALVVGDSFTEGYGASSAEATWASIAAGTLGWQATIDGVGGTGFTKRSATDGSQGVGFRDRLLRHADDGVDYDVVVLQGGLNDWKASAVQESAAVRHAVHTAQDAWPDAVVVVFGPAEPLADGVKRLELLPAIRDASEEAGAVFIDPSAPTPWITPANTDVLDLGDGLHLNDAGYAYLAARFVAEVQSHQARD